MATAMPDRRRPPRAGGGRCSVHVIIASDYGGGAAAQAEDAALTTASAEVKWRNGFATGATFEGEFSNVTRNCAGKGFSRQVW